MGISRAFNSICTKFWINWWGTNVNDIGSQFLHSAAYYQDKDLIDFLIKKGIDLNMLNKKGNSTLHNSVKSCDLTIADYLLLKNANADILDSAGYTPLYYALKNDEGAISQKLISSGASINSNLKGFSTLLHNAAINGHIASTTILLNHKLDANFCNADGNIPAYYALTNSNFKTFQLLAPHTYLNHVNEVTGRTLLHAASQSGLTEAVKILINSNVNLSVIDKNDYSAIGEAIVNGHIHIARNIINAGGKFNTTTEGGTLINKSAANNLTNSIKFLLKFGISINAYDANGNIPIYYAKTSSMIDFLCQNGAKVDFKDNLGYTPLHKAVRDGSHEKVNILLKHGANPDTISYNQSHNVKGSSALYDALSIAHDGKIASALFNAVDSSRARAELVTKSGIMSNHIIIDAAENNYLSIIDFFNEIRSYGKPSLTNAIYHALSKNNIIAASKLENLGARFDVRASKNIELLHKAVKNKWYDCAEKLLKLGIDPNSYDLGNKYSSSKHTPLYYAIENSDAKMVNTLLYYKANPNQLDLGSNRHNVYHAVSKGNIEILKSLVHKDADVTRIDHTTGQTPLMLAIKLSGVNSLHKFSDIIDLLLYDTEKSASINLNIIDPATNKNCLQLAIDYGQVVIAKKLLENKFVSIDTPKDFEAILKISKPEDREALAKAFFDSPALSNIDVNSKYFDKGQTFLHKAAESGCEKIVEILKAKGASLTIKDMNGYSAADIAIKQSRADSFVAKLMPPEDCQSTEDASTTVIAPTTNYVPAYAAKLYPDLSPYQATLSAPLMEESETHPYASAPPLEEENPINGNSYTTYNNYLPSSATFVDQNNNVYRYEPSPVNVNDPYVYASAPPLEEENPINGNSYTAYNNYSPSSVTFVDQNNNVYWYEPSSVNVNDPYRYASAPPMEESDTYLHPSAPPENE